MAQPPPPRQKLSKATPAATKALQAMIARNKLKEEQASIDYQERMERENILEVAFALGCDLSKRGDNRAAVCLWRGILKVDPTYKAANSAIESAKRTEEALALARASEMKKKALDAEDESYSCTMVFYLVALVFLSCFCPNRVNQWTGRIAADAADRAAEGAGSSKSSKYKTNKNKIDQRSQTTIIDVEKGSGGGGARASDGTAREIFTTRTNGIVPAMSTDNFLKNLKRGSLDFADRLIVLIGIAALVSVLLIFIGVIELAAGSELTGGSTFCLGLYVLACAGGLLAYSYFCASIQY